MRIWDIHPSLLCRAHLLGEHRELHAIWSVLTRGRSGYRNHPETRRWVGKEAALFARHLLQVDEMLRRGWRHASELDTASIAGSSAEQHQFVNTLAEQVNILVAKGCDCRVRVNHLRLEAGKDPQNES